MSNPSIRTLPSILVIAAGELLLILIAAGLGWLFLGQAFPFELGPASTGLLYGVAVAVPPAVLVVLVWRDGGRRWPGVWAEFEGIVERLEPALGSMLVSLGPAGMFVIALAAGLGEEILFRGVLQPLLGIVLASVIFGALHALSLGYFLFATVFGFYLGWVFEATGHLAVPIVAHAAYDVFALYLLRRIYVARRDAPAALETP